MYAEYGKKEDMDNSYRYYRMEDFIYDYNFKDIYMFQDVPKSMQGKLLFNLYNNNKGKKQCNTKKKHNLVCMTLQTSAFVVNFFCIIADATCVNRHKLHNVPF